MMPKTLVAPVLGFVAVLFTVLGVVFLAQGHAVAGVAELVCAALEAGFCYLMVKQ